MRYLLDTNIWIYGLAGDGVIRRFLETATGPSWIGYSVITWIEVFGYPSMTGRAEQAAREVLGQYERLALDADVVRRTIRLRKAVRIKVPDAIIAASALASSATLVTRNIDDFKQVADLSVLDPFAAT